MKRLAVIAAEHLHYRSDLTLSHEFSCGRRFVGESFFERSTAVIVSPTQMCFRGRAIFESIFMIML
jgi:hypothetical protein